MLTTAACVTLTFDGGSWSACRGHRPAAPAACRCFGVEVAGFVNARARQTGHLSQGQFGSALSAHLAGRDDGLVRVKPLRDRAPHFADLIDGEADTVAFALLERSERIGRPLGSAAFVAAIKKRLGRALATGKRGRKPRKEGADGENILREIWSRHRTPVLRPFKT